MLATDEPEVIYGASGTVFAVYSNIAFAEGEGGEIIRRRKGESYEDFIIRLIGEVP